MGSAIKRVTQKKTVLPLTAVQNLSKAVFLDDKKGIKKAKGNVSIARKMEVFIGETELMTLFRQNLEDEKGSRQNGKALRNYARACSIFYAQGEIIPSAHEVLLYAFSSKTLRAWVESRKVGRAEIEIGLDAIKALGLAKQKSKGKGLYRWISHEEFLALLNDKSVAQDVIATLDKCLQAIGTGAEKLIIWTLGK